MHVLHIPIIIIGVHPSLHCHSFIQNTREKGPFLLKLSSTMIAQSIIRVHQMQSPSSTCLALCLPSCLKSILLSFSVTMSTASILLNEVFSPSTTSFTFYKLSLFLDISRFLQDLWSIIALNLHTMIKAIFTVRAETVLFHQVNSPAVAPLAFYLVLGHLGFLIGVEYYVTLPAKTVISHVFFSVASMTLTYQIQG